MSKKRKTKTLYALSEAHHAKVLGKILNIQKGAANEFSYKSALAFGNFEKSYQGFCGTCEIPLTKWLSYTQWAQIESIVEAHIASFENHDAHIRSKNKT